MMKDTYELCKPLRTEKHINGELRMKITDAQKFVSKHKDTLDKKFYDELMSILERPTGKNK